MRFFQVSRLAGWEASSTLIAGILGDVTDHDELVNGTRREDAFSSVFSWLLKLSISLGLLASGPLVVWLGFDAKLGAAQPDTTLFWERILLAAIPAVFIGGAIWALLLYPLVGHSRKKAPETRRGAF
jgi:GPH family glycoside/pentoside/hexuronide:cation symporter